MIPLHSTDSRLFQKCANTLKAWCQSYPDPLYLLEEETVYPPFVLSIPALLCLCTIIDDLFFLQRTKKYRTTLRMFVSIQEGKSERNQASDRTIRINTSV